VILAQSGNVHTVKIQVTPGCDCGENKDGANPRGHCKHIYFVLLRILEVDRESALLFQRAFLVKELDRIFESSPKPPSHLYADPTVVEKYLQLTTKRKSKSEPEVPQKSVEGDCVVCYEPMTATEEIIYCKFGCGNNLHKACFDEWREKTKASQQPNRPPVEIRCVYCRKPWPMDKQDYMKNGYLNLGALQERAQRPSESIWWFLPQLLMLQNIHRLRRERARTGLQPFPTATEDLSHL